MTHPITPSHVPAGSTPEGDGILVGGGPVRVNVFIDFQCPFCGKVEETLKELRDSYGDRIRLVWKNEPLPFHPRAEPAAELAYEARAEKGDAAFWAVHDRIFADQAHLTRWFRRYYGITPGAYRSAVGPQAGTDER